MIRVLIAEGSPFQANFLSRVLKDSGVAESVGVAPTRGEGVPPPPPGEARPLAPRAPPPVKEGPPRPPRLRVKRIDLAARACLTAGSLRRPVPYAAKKSKRLPPPLILIGGAGGGSRAGPA